jgi:hypothetical protein
MSRSSLEEESTTVTRADAALREAALKNCEALGKALHGDLAETVEEVQKLILNYYGNVRAQAAESFASAKRVALIGFVLLVVTIVYVIGIDLLLHMQASGFAEPPSGGMNVGAIGLIAAGIVEAIAGTQFVLYGRATRQFGAFHICLERTHRYLLATRWRRGWDSNPRAGYPTRRFRGAPVTTTSVPLRSRVVC